MRLINLKIKILFIVIGLILFFVFGSVLLIFYIIKDDFDSLEKEELNQRSAMVLSMVLADTKNLVLTVRDYAVWDDTYSFVANNDPEYLNSNFTSYSLNNLKINFVLIQNKSEETIYQNYSNYDTSTPPQFLSTIKADISTAQKSFKDLELGYSINGLIDSPDGLMMVGISAIRDGINSQSVNGSLTFGRILDKSLLEEYSDNINLPLNFIAYNSSDFKKNLLKVKNALKNQKVTYLKENNQYYAYSLLYDINNKPVTIIEIQSNLNFANKAFRSFASLLIGLFSVSLIFGCFLVIVLYFIFIKRIDNLNLKLKTINLQRDELIDSKIKSQDEIGSLVENINKIINFFKSNQLKLKKSNDELIYQNAELKLINERIISKNLADHVSDSTKSKNEEKNTIKL